MQDFEYTFDKQIKHAGEYNLCVTVTNGKSRRGGGGFPTHLVRFLKIDYYLEAKNEHYTWQMID